MSCVTSSNFSNTKSKTGRPNIVEILSGERRGNPATRSFFVLPQHQLLQPLEQLVMPGLDLVVNRTELLVFFEKPLVRFLQLRVVLAVPFLLVDLNLFVSISLAQTPLNSIDYRSHAGACPPKNASHRIAGCCASPACPAGPEANGPRSGLRAYPKTGPVGWLS
jgi:hypothetical protein